MQFYLKKTIMAAIMISMAIIQLCREVQASGGRAMLVGGWVRDFLRGRETADYDVEVYGIEADRLLGLLGSIGSVNTVGEAFTVYKVRLRDRDRHFVVDVSLPRRESKSGRGHKGFIVHGDPHMSVEEAARRRDFTINAMMYDPLKEEYIDPFNGRGDLERKIIRVVDPRTFIEDSLRVLRAMQFASRFEFDIDAGTVGLCRTIDLSDLPAERIWGEVEKWLMLSDHPSIGLEAARELGIIEKLWPEVSALIGCPQPEDAHPEGDVFTHTGMTIDQARALVGDLPRSKAITIMLAALCHDFGKPANAQNHAHAGIAPAECFLDRLKVFTIDNYDIRGQVLSLVRHHLIPVAWFGSHIAGESISDGAFRRLAREIEPGLLYLLELANRLGRGGSTDSAAERWFIERVRQLGVEQHAPPPILMGRHVLELGLQPGPQIGEITRAVYERQLDGEITSLDEAVAAASKLITATDQ